MRPTFFRLSALSLAVLAATAHAQSSARNDDGGYDLEAIQVQSSADASKGGLSEAFAGGQVAEGGRSMVFECAKIADRMQACERRGNPRPEPMPKPKPHTKRR